MPPHRKTCDLSAALRRMGGNVELLTQIIEFYRDDLPRYITRLRQAVANGDPAGVQHAAHSLKGLLVNFDAEAAAHCALELEQLGQLGDITNAGDGVALLEEEIARLDDALNLELASLSGEARGSI